MKTVGTNAVPPPLATPLLPVNGVWVKAEGKQRTGSVKYRLVSSRVEAALRAGTLRPGQTLMEVSSGSTGVALAWIGRACGFPVEVHAYEGASRWKLAQMTEWGTRVVLHPASDPMRALLEEVGRRAEGAGAWLLGQYRRDAGKEAYEDLAVEMLRQLGEAGVRTPRVFAAPVGTGGLLQGVGAALRRAVPGIRIVAIEPAPGAVIEGMRRFRSEHLGAEDPFDIAFPDAVEVAAAAPPAAIVAGRAIGESASATMEVVRRQGWPDAVIVAAD